MLTPEQVYLDLDPVDPTKEYEPDKADIRAMLDALFDGVKPFRMDLAAAQAKADMAIANLKMAVLGDSTGAGVGNGGDGEYGLCRGPHHGSHWNLLYYDLVMGSTRFIPPSSDISIPLYGPYEPWTGPSSNFYVPFRHHRLLVSASPTATFRAFQKSREESRYFTFYVVERTDPSAARFRVKISSTSSSTVTIASGTPGVITWLAHGLPVGATIVFSTTGALPTGLTAGTTYYVVAASTNTLQVSTTSGGAAVAVSGSQSGVHTANATIAQANQIIDTYVAAESFLTTTQAVGGRLRAETITMATAGRELSIEVSSVDVIARTEGTATDGTAIIAGFAFGSGIRFKNFAVSGMTLLNSSAANVSKDVTTDFVVNQVIAYAPNWVVMGWLTNDSKPGISTIDALKTSYRSRIDQLRAALPKVKIILETAPRGAIGSEYANNTLYNEALREIAIEKDCVLFDREAIFDLCGSNAYSDDVHPSEAGYTGLAEILCTAFGVVSSWRGQTEGDAATAKSITTAGLTVNSETAGTPVLTSLREITDIPRPAGAKAVNVQTIIGLKDTSAIDGAYFEQQIASNSAFTGATNIGRASVSAPVVNGFARTQVTMNRTYAFAKDSTTKFSIRVRGQHFTANTDAAEYSNVTYTFLF